MHLRSGTLSRASCCAPFMIASQAWLRRTLHRGVSAKSETFFERELDWIRI